MIKSTTTIQATIEDLLTAEPMAAQEIADKVGVTVALLRLAMATLEHKGKMMRIGQRPVRYCAPFMFTHAARYLLRTSVLWFRFILLTAWVSIFPSPLIAAAFLSPALFPDSG